MIKNSPHFIDTDKELEHLIEFIRFVWDTNENFESLMKEIWSVSTLAAAQLIDPYGFTEQRKWLQERQDCLILPNVEPSQKKTLIFFDALANLYTHILINSMSVSEKTNNSWDYEKINQQILKEIKTNAGYSDAKKLKPKGWRKLLNSGRENDYAQMHETMMHKQFKGVDSESAAAPGFALRVSPQSVVYDHLHQGRTPLVTLVGAIVGHAYAVLVHNNTLKIKQELNSLKLELENTYGQTGNLVYCIESSLIDKLQLSPTTLLFLEGALDPSVSLLEFEKLCAQTLEPAKTGLETKSSKIKKPFK